MSLSLARKALEQRATAFEQRKAILDDATKTDAEKRSAVEAVDAEMLRLEQDAQRHIEVAESENRAAALMQRLGGNAAAETTQADKDAESLRSLARGEVREVSFDLRTALSSVPANAGNTIPTATFVDEVQQALRFRSSFLSLVRTMTTGSGETLEFPVKNALNPATAPVSGVGRVAENTAYAKGDQSWSKVSLGAYKYGVIVEATQEIVADSALPILSILGADAGETLADKIMADLLLGTGANQPFGWVTRATAGLNAASLSAVTFDNLLDLQYSVTAPYRRNAVYMVSDTAVGTIRKIKDNQGRYLWTPSVAVDQPDTIHGKPVLTDPNLATSGASAKVALFGDPSKYVLRQVKDITVTRSDEYGFDRDVVAFKVNWRGSGDLFDLNSVKALTVTA